jgi:C4-dicarboxylate-specific signal transduction histidine kinase
LRGHPTLSAATIAFVDFFRALTHEINQPLASILSNAQAAQHLMNAARVDRAEVQAILKDISGQNKRLSETFKELRVLMNHCEAALRPVNLAEVVQDALVLARNDLLERGISVRTRLTDEALFVRAAYLQVRQVLLALIRCACTMAQNPAPESVIVISSKPHADEVRVTIEAHGLASQARSLFTRPREELRLAIAMCRLIVAAHEGTFWMTRSADRSFRFHFTVPIFRETKT